MIDMYVEESPAPLFLTGMFQTPPKNFFESEKVEIDIVRDDEDIAVVLTDLSVDANKNEATTYVNKAFTPPIFDEEGDINAYKLIKRRAGEDPFQDPVYARNALAEADRVTRKCEGKITRAVELMCAQALQTGVVSCIDSSGAVKYTLDYGMKSTHKITIATSWALNGSTGAPLNDLEDAAIIGRRDGKAQMDQLIFGKTAIRRFLANADVKTRVFSANNSQGMAQLAPASRGEGATFMGRVWVGQYLMDMWMYDGWYKHPQTGVLTPYVADDNIIMKSTKSRLDVVFGAIPRVATADPRAMPFMPGRISNSAKSIDLSRFAWFTPDGKHLKVSAGTCPLAIPTQIDSVVCITTT